MFKCKVSSFFSFFLLTFTFLSIWKQTTEDLNDRKEVAMLKSVYSSSAKNMNSLEGGSLIILGHDVWTFPFCYNTQKDKSFNHRNQNTWEMFQCHFLSQWKGWQWTAHKMSCNLINFVWKTCVFEKPEDSGH